MKSSSEVRLPVDDGVELAALTWERDGPTRPPDVLLVHGLASNARTWWGVGPALATRGHRVAAIDLRGHGQSSKPDSGYDHPRLVADLVAVLDALDYKRALVVGQSWGGNLALALAHHRPDRVAGVVGVDGGGIDLSAQFADWETCLAALTPPPTDGLPVATIRGYLDAEHADWPEAAREATLANFAVRSDGTVAPNLTLARHLAILRAMWNDKPTDQPVDAPVLLLPVANRDAAWTEAKRQQLATLTAVLPQLTVRWLEGYDHDVHAQAPEVVVAEVSNWLEGGALS